MGTCAQLSRGSVAVPSHMPSVLLARGQTDHILEQDRAADSQMRDAYGSRWTAVPTEDMVKAQRAKIAQIRAVLEQAGRSDGEVKAKLDANRSAIAGLQRDRAAVASSVPSVTGASALSAREADLAKRLRSSLDELNALLAARDGLLAAVSKKTNPVRSPPPLTPALRSPVRRSPPLTQLPSRAQHCEPSIASLTVLLHAVLSCRGIVFISVKLGSM